MTAAAQVLIYGCILIVLAIVLGGVFLWSRRRLREPAKPERADFTVESLESLHRRSLISEEEFYRLRLQALGLEAPAPPPPLRRGEANDDETAGEQG